MAKFLHPDVLDNGLQYIIDQASASNVDMLLITSYTQGNAYATVNSNKVCEIDMVAGDFSLANQGTYGRKLVVASKAGTANAAATGPHDLHVAIVDVTNSKVLAVTDETSNRNISNAEPLTIPSFDANMNQPV